MRKQTQMPVNARSLRSDAGVGQRISHGVLSRTVAEAHPREDRPTQEQADLRPITDQNGARCLSLPRTAHHRGLPLLLAQVPISLLLGSVRSNTLRAVARGPPLKRGLGLGLQSDPYGSPALQACLRVPRMASAFSRALRSEDFS